MRGKACGGIGQKCLGRALLDDLAVLDDQHTVGGTGQAEAVRNDQRGAALHQSFYSGELNY